MGMFLFNHNQLPRVSGSVVGRGGRPRARGSAAVFSSRWPGVPLEENVAQQIRTVGHNAVHPEIE